MGAGRDAGRCKRSGGQWGRRRWRARPMEKEEAAGTANGVALRGNLLVGASGAVIVGGRRGGGGGPGRGREAGAAVGTEGRSLAACGGSFKAVCLVALPQLRYRHVPSSLPQQQGASSSTLTLCFLRGLPTFEREVCGTAVTQCISCLFFC